MTDFENINWQQFEQVQLRVGTVVAVTDFEKALKPAYQLVIDFGPEFGQRRSSAQITKHYSKELLLGKQVICVCNFPVKQIANFFSEVLVTGFADQNGDIILAVPDKPSPNFAKLV
jgi:tRNA-binding protein